MRLKSFRFLKGGLETPYVVSYFISGLLAKLRAGCSCPPFSFHPANGPPES